MPAHLVAIAVGGSFSSLADVILKAHTAQLTHLALHDSLTLLPNRLLLEDRIDRMIAQQRRHGSYFALMFIDLDGFKPINDNFGHHIGDNLLRAVAERLRTNIRNEDTLAHLGGDEFVLLAQVDSPKDALVLAAKSRKLLSEPFYINDLQMRISGSIGIALYPEHGATQRELLGNADVAMYHTKHNGKNGYSLFELSMGANVRTMD